MSSLDVAPPPAKTLSASRSAHPRFATWANRTAVMSFVSLCAIFGILLVILPWSPKWTDNYLLISYPALRDFIENGFVRGMCSGLGALDIWIGFWQATHYQENSGSK
jgi:hypothetical protein